MLQVGAVQGPFVGRAVDAQRQPRDHGQAAGAEAFGKGPGILGALGRGVAAAHDGDAALQLCGREGACPQGVKHQRRVFHGEQGGGVCGVTQGEHGMCMGSGAAVLQPLLRAGQQRIQAGRWRLQRFGLSGGHHLQQCRKGLFWAQVLQPV